MARGVVRITHKSEGWTPGPAWWDDYVGESFPLLDIMDGIPVQYQVDVSRLVEAGRMAESSRGLAYVPQFAAEIVS